MHNKTVNIKYNIIKTARKTLCIQIKENASVLVRCPFNSNLTTIENFVKKNIQWINKKRELIKKQAVSRKIRKAVDGELFPFRGKEYPLKLIETADKNIYFDGDFFYLSRNLSEKACRMFEIFYRKQAQIILKNKLEYFSSKYKIKYNNFKITSGKKRIASCSSDKNLNFSWRLLFADESILDYIILHELIHTQELNHSKNFWKKLEKIMPDCKNQRKELKKYEFEFYMA